MMHITSKRLKQNKAGRLLLASASLLLGLAATNTSPSRAAAEPSKSTPQDKRSAAPSSSSSSSTVPAAADRTISLRASFDAANQHNKEIIAAQFNLPIARAQIQAASAVLNPHFNLQYGWGPAFRLIYAGNPQQFGWQEEIQTAGKRSKQINLAKANYRLSEFQIAALLFDVHNRVRRAYSSLAAAEAYEALVEEQRKVAQELFTVADRRFDAGKGPKSQVFQAELLVSQFDTQRNQAQLNLQQAAAALALLIGETPTRVEVIDVDDNGLFRLSVQKTDLVPSPDHNLPELEKLLPVADQQRPDLRVAIQQKHADRRALTLAKSKAVPDVFADSGYQFTTFRKTQPAGLLNGNATVPFQAGAYLNITAPLPFFYQQQGEIKQAKETWLQDSEQIEQLKWQIATDIVTAYERVVVARANIVKNQTELIPEAATLARLARRAYQVGKSDISTAILAQQQYQQILSSYFDTVVAYQNAWADMEKAVGVPLQL
jgi:cobalt-zinc-cadmium efflux system outer membrane protein